MIRGLLFLFLCSFSLVSAAVSDLPPITDNPGAPNLTVPAPPEDSNEGDEGAAGSGGGVNESATENQTEQEAENLTIIPEEIISDQQPVPDEQTSIPADVPGAPEDFNTGNLQENSSQNQLIDFKLPLTIVGIVVFFILMGLLIWKKRKDSLPDSI